MPSQSQELRIKLNQLSSSFTEKETVFRRSIIIFNFVEAIFNNKEAKKVFNFLMAEASKEVGSAEIGEKEDILKAKFSCNCYFWRYFADLDFIHSRMLEMKQEKDNYILNKLDKTLCRPYSVNVFQIAFQVVGDCILEKMEQNEFFKKTKRDDKIWFDFKKSILYIQNYKIPIAKQAKETNAHKILQYIFKDNKDNINDHFFYSEIAEDVFEDLEYKQDKNSWRRYHRTCQVINEKIFKDTENAINNFLVFNTGQKGFLKITSEFI